ncbi:MAG: glycosyltransferase, partial [Chloroflexota bacterium]
TGNVDGMPIVVLEAMAAGKAIVASRVGGIPQVIVDGETGLLVDERSPSNLAGAIARFISNPAERFDCGARARRVVERELTWPIVARRFVEIYQEALSEYRD